MIEHREPPNWVLGRAECTLAMTFEALTQIVERDVNEANKAIEGRTFEFEQCTEGMRPFVRVSEKGTDKAIDISITNTNAIRVSGAGVKPGFYVRPRWDGKRCRLYVRDDDPQELWQISQVVLENLFFGDLSDIPHT